MAKNTCIDGLSATKLCKQHTKTVLKQEFSIMQTR
jgi:hypothetical protein